MNRPLPTWGWFVIFASIFIGFFLMYAPTAVLYFDQQSGEATITSLSGKNIHFEYYHEDKGEIVKLSYREGNSLQRRRLEENMSIDILYSKRFPTLVSILNYDPRPNLSALILLAIPGRRLAELIEKIFHSPISY